MSKLKSLVKDTAIYGLSSIVGRFLNYLLVPLYTAKMSAESGNYGVVTNIYAYMCYSLFCSVSGRGAEEHKVSSPEIFKSGCLAVLWWRQRYFVSATDHL